MNSLEWKLKIPFVNVFYLSFSYLFVFIYFILSSLTPQSSCTQYMVLVTALRLAIPLITADFRQPRLTFTPYIINFFGYEMHVVLDEQTKEDITPRFLRARKSTVLFNSKQKNLLEKKN